MTSQKLPNSSPTGVALQDVLEPTKPSWTNRYNDKLCPATTHVSVTAGQFSYGSEQQPQYLPPGWSEHCHPEGQSYFACNSAPSMVTDVDMHSERVQEKMAHCIDVLNGHLTKSNIRLPDTAEIYVDFPENSDERGRYYVADHATQNCTWLEEIQLETLDMGYAVSESHLRLACTQLYWDHLEYYPHDRNGLLNTKVDELIGTFTHGRIDGLTSESSTFPYSPAQCSQLIESLNFARLRINSSESICSVARLWSIIYGNRVMAHHGQRSARLSSDQYIMAERPTRSRLFPVASGVLFGLPATYIQQLERLWVDNSVYEHRWREAMGTWRDEWKMFASWALGLMIINGLLMLSPYGSRTIASASIVCCQIALLAAAYLLVRLHGATKYTASDAATYLAGACGERTGLEVAAVVYSVPKALFVWALGVSSLQSLMWLRNATNDYVVGALALFIILFVFSVRGYPVVQSWCRRVSQRFSGRRVREDDDIMV